MCICIYESNPSAVFQTCHQSNHPFLQVHTSLREGTSKVRRLCQNNYSWAARRDLWRKIRPCWQPAVCSFFGQHPSLWPLTAVTTGSVKHDHITVAPFAGLERKTTRLSFILSGCWPWHITFPMLHELRHLRDLFSASKYGCRSRPGWQVDSNHQIKPWWPFKTWMARNIIVGLPLLLSARFVELMGGALAYAISFQGFWHCSLVLPWLVWC